MTKDEALIYWVMRFGVDGVEPDLTITTSTEYKMHDLLTPRIRNTYVREDWWLGHNYGRGGWFINDRGLQRLKELGHEQT
jgi:hypothetical protein